MHGLKNFTKLLEKAAIHGVGKEQLLKKLAILQLPTLKKICWYYFPGFFPLNFQ